LIFLRFKNFIFILDRLKLSYVSYKISLVRTCIGLTGFESIDRARSPMVHDLPYSGFAIFGISHGVGDHEIWEIPNMANPEKNRKNFDVI